MEFALRVFSLADAMGHVETLLKDFDPGYCRSADFTHVHELAQRSIFSSAVDAPSSPSMPRAVDSGPWSGILQANQCLTRTKACFSTPLLVLM